MNIIVGVADMKLAQGDGNVLVTHALGSCVGVCIHDPKLKIGGLLHYMLPEAAIAPDKARQRPYMFGDTGITLLFKEAYLLGTSKPALSVKLVGGAQTMDSNGVFNIGQKNYAMARKLFYRNNVMVAAEEVGGTTHRTVHLDVGTGAITIKIKGGGVINL
ncbi:MAG: chemotaxis protein CheD [Deltaproteobacteria bacterium]|nr:chemotaxis protein CheD [Deltaproteobacteria bacterium]